MMIPIRCFSCGFPVSAFYEDYKQAVAKGKKPGKVLDELKIGRYCCRRMFLGQVDVIDEIAPFKK